MLIDATSIATACSDVRCAVFAGEGRRRGLASWPRSRLKAEFTAGRLRDASGSTAAGVSHASMWPERRMTASSGSLGRPAVEFDVGGIRDRLRRRQRRP